MSEPKLIQRQREILRAFRQVTAVRVKAESDAEACKAERNAAETKFQNAQKQAEAERARAEAEAKSRLDAERTAVNRIVAEQRQQADSLLKRIQAVLEKAHSLLRENKQESLLKQVIASPSSSITETTPTMEMRGCLHRAESAFGKLEEINYAPTVGKMIAVIGTAFVFAFVGAIIFPILYYIYAKVSVPSGVLLSAYVPIFALSLIPAFLVNRYLFRSPRPFYTAIAQAASDAVHWRDLWLQQVQAEQQPRISTAESANQQAVAQARSAFEKRRNLVTEEYNSASTAIESRYQQILAKARGEYESSIPTILADAQSVIISVNTSMPPWDSILWESWTPRAVADGAYPIGRLSATGQWHNLVLPSLIPFVGSRSLLLRNPNSANQVIARAAQSFLLRLLHTIPPAKLRFTFIDPIGLGQNVAPFMHLADYDEALVTGKAWTEPQHIEQRLADLTEHLENVIQKYLRNQFATIEDYNAQAGEVAEPYRVLVVMDFPTNFSEAAARRLVSIAQNGPRCGVYAVILADTDKPLPHGFNLADLERVSTVIAWDGKRFVWQDEDFKDCQLELDTPPSAELFNRIITTVGEAAKEASKVEVPFERIAPPQAEWWTGDSRNGLRIALGPSGARKVQYLDLGKGTTHHVLVAGRVGAGKSTLLHTLINNLALAYSPTEVELYLIDFKKGVEFKTYATHQLPHARVIAIESEREFGLSVLQGLDAELKRRGDLFRSIGVDHIADYREKTKDESGRMKAENSSFISHPSSLPLPRILLLVDEFQEFFTEDDSIASQSSQILDRLVRQGRAFGIHVLLGSQTLAGAYTLARSTIDQMAVRIALQCSEADSRLILADDNPAARLLSRPGEAIYNASNGMVEGNNRFQVAWLPDDKRDQYLEHVRALARERNYKPPQSQIVFEGNAPAEVEKNRALYDLLTSPAPSTPPRVLRAWLGDPIAIREPVAANFRRQSGNNLLIVGQNDEAALGMMSVALIGLAAQSPTSNLQSLYILDFGAVDASYADFFARLAEQMPQPIKIGRRRQLPEIIGELAAEVQRRIDANSASASTKFLFLYGLQRARDLRQEDSFALPLSGDEPAAPNPAQQFATILREGPDVGVHTLVWCDTLTNLNRSLDRRALREFAMRVVFQMGAEDSANLIDTPAASKLGSYRALFYSEEEGRLEKFRPYALPSEQWLKWVGEQLRGKAA
jgi:ABC-type branched-subunit amino acid transport system ATPase component